MPAGMLEQLGFTKKEEAIYLALLRHGASSPAELARLTRISRPTVYSAAKTLLKKGIIHEDLAGAARTYIPKPPRDLAVMLNREERQLEKKRDAVARAVSELESLARETRYPVPKIVFIPEEELEEYLYREAPRWTKSVLASDKIWWGFQDHTFVEHYKKWIDWHWKHVPQAGMTIRLLTNPAPIEERMRREPYRDVRHVRVWENAANFTATTWVVGEYVIMIFTLGRPHYLVEIHDAMLAGNLRQVFAGIWKTEQKTDR